MNAHDVRRPSPTAGVLSRNLEIRIVELGRGGCRLLIPAPLATGMQGTLRMTVGDGVYYEDIRVVQCDAAHRSGRYAVGVEFVGRVNRNESLIRHVLDRLTAPAGNTSAERQQLPDSETTVTGDKTMKEVMLRLVRDEDGQDLIEYALLAGFVSLACVAILTTLGGSLNTLYTNVNSRVSSAAATGS